MAHLLPSLASVLRVGACPGSTVIDVVHFQGTDPPPPAPMGQLQQRQDASHAQCSHGAKGICRRPWSARAMIQDELVVVGLRVGTEIRERPIQNQAPTQCESRIPTPKVMPGA